MPVISSDFRIPNDNRPHIKVGLVHGESKITTVVALADTGAQICCISNELAQQLELPVLGREERITGSAGPMQTSKYKIDGIVLPNNSFFKIESILGYAKCGNTSDLILGMDILGRGFFSVSFDGKMLIAF